MRISQSKKIAGTTFLELIIVAGIVVLALSMGFMHYRNSRPQATNMASSLALHMDVRRATDVLTENLLDGVEVVKPIEGSSLSFLVMKDVVNKTKIFYLEKADQKSNQPRILVSYTDSYTGSFQQDKRKVLFGNVKDILFTTLSPGLVLVNLTLVDQNEKEFSSIFEVPLKNLGTIDG